MIPRAVLVSVACLALFFIVPAEGQHGAETSSESESTTEIQSLCGLQQQTLYNQLENKVYKDYNISINCLQFNSEAELERGIVSVFSETAERRDVIECRGGFLVTSPSLEPPDRFDIRDSNLSGCLRCNDNTTGAGICDDPCDGICERCYDEPNRCTRCTACRNPSSEVCANPSATKMCNEECNDNQEPSSTLYNTCECQEGYYKLYNTYSGGPGPNPSFDDQEEAGLEHCPPNAQEQTPSFTCTKDCTRGGALANFAPNEESHICFACGLEDCFVCENPDDHAQCVQCLAERVLFEEECFSCPIRDTAYLALEQEHEVELEEEAKTRTSIELGISLPIVCIAVILFFVLVSLFAHYRYPHISHRGHKRHRKPNEPQLPSDGSDLEADDQDRQLDSSHVWRARPTIRLR